MTRAFVREHVRGVYCYRQQDLASAYPAVMGTEARPHFQSQAPLSLEMPIQSYFLWRLIPKLQKVLHEQ